MEEGEQIFHKTSGKVPVLLKKKKPILRKSATRKIFFLETTVLEKVGERVVNKKRNWIMTA